MATKRTAQRNATYDAARAVAARNRTGKIVPLRKTDGTGQLNGSTSTSAKAQPPRKRAAAAEAPHWSELPPRPIYNPNNPAHYPCGSCGGNGSTLRLGISPCTRCAGTGVDPHVTLTAYARKHRS